MSKSPASILSDVLAVKTASGLLQKYITWKSAIYREPQRRGTPRGEAIGFSRQKYRASLFALEAGQVMEQARKLHAVYPVVRKWRTEPAFIEAVNAHAREFVSQVLFPFLRERQQPQFDQWEKAIQSGNIATVMEMLQDSKTLRAELINRAEFGKPIHSELERLTKSGTLSPSDEFALIRIFLSSLGEREFTSNFVRAVLDQTIVLLKQGELSDAMRTKLAALLTMTRQALK